MEILLIVVLAGVALLIWLGVKKSKAAPPRAANEYKTIIAPGGAAANRVAKSQPASKAESRAQGSYAGPSSTSPMWKETSKGNPTLRIEGYHLTIFERDGGWKFCVSEGDDDEDPHFSGVYENQTEAQNAGLKWAEAAIPTSRDTPTSLLPIAKNIGEEAKALSVSVPSRLATGLSSADLMRLNDNLQDKAEAAARLQERAEDVDADNLASALERNPISLHHILRRRSSLRILWG